MRVFERLYTGRDGPGRAIGTGLGLAIVRELSAAMGGTAQVDPTSAVGSRILVTVRSGAVARVTQERRSAYESGSSRASA